MAQVQPVRLRPPTVPEHAVAPSVGHTDATSDHESPVVSNSSRHSRPSTVGAAVDVGAPTETRPPTNSGDEGETHRPLTHRDLQGRHKSRFTLQDQLSIARLVDRIRAFS